MNKVKTINNNKALRFFKVFFKVLTIIFLSNVLFTVALLDAMCLLVKIWESDTISTNNISDYYTLDPENYSFFTDIPENAEVVQYYRFHETAYSTVPITEVYLELSFSSEAALLNQVDKLKERGSSKVTEDGIIKECKNPYDSAYMNIYEKRYVNRPVTMSGNFGFIIDLDNFEVVSYSVDELTLIWTAANREYTTDYPRYYSRFNIPINIEVRNSYYGISDVYTDG